MATETETTPVTFERNLEDHIRAGYQILLVPTSEEARALAAIQRTAENLQISRGRGMRVATWDGLNGFDGKLVNPVMAFKAITDLNTFESPNTIVVFRDAHKFYHDPAFLRAVKAAAEQNSLSNSRHTRPVVFLQGTRHVDPDIAPYVATVEFALPTVEALEQTFEATREAIRDEAKKRVTPELRYKIVQALRGLTATEASNVLSLCLIRHGGFGEDILGTIEAQKSAMIRRSEALTYTPRDQVPHVENLGGYGNLLDFVRRKSLCYTPEAAALRLDHPKGMVLVGVPGTAKSVASMAVARVLQLPLVELDFGRLFSSLVGASEERLRNVIATVTALDGCVLVIDEADKSLGGAAEASGDSGVTRRLFGMFLSWLAVKKDRTFVILTLNRTVNMPPELLRKGRFDEIFYTDLPTDAEARSIFEIHMRLRGVDPGQYTAAEWRKFLQEAKGFVGSEIEEAVKAAREAAFQLSTLHRLIVAHRAAAGAERAELDDRLRPFSAEAKTQAFDLDDATLAKLDKAVPTADLLIAAIKDGAVTRLGKVDEDNIKAIRKFGEERARPASAERWAASVKKTTRVVDA
jgi:hypothetical protein